MQLSVATANLYFRSFEETLGVIADSGFRCIELDLFWARKEWAIAQHLREFSPKRVVRLIEQAGLRITSIHDGGGVLEEQDSILGFINPDLDEYLVELGYTPDCLVFHTPHMEGSPGAGWWKQISGEIVGSLEKYRKACEFVTIENMPLFDGYFVPLTTPQELAVFAAENALHVTFDTTHYAQIGTDIMEAARVLGDRIKTVHLSDFRGDKTHVFIGEGDLNLAGFLDALDLAGVNAITLETSLSSIDMPDRQMSYNELVGRLREARARLEGFL